MKRAIQSVVVAGALFFIISVVYAEETFHYPKQCDLMEYSVWPNGMYHNPSFYPVGWSEDGKFAYVVRRMLEGVGGSRTDFVIFDAVEDVRSFHVRHESIPGPPGEPGGEGLFAEEGEAEGEESVSLEEMERQFAGALERYSIVKDTGALFKPFPLKINNETYTAEVITTPETDKDAFNDEIGTYDVFVVSSSGRKKRITGSNDVQGLSLWIAGYFLSPFEPRVLVVIGRESFVFEGAEPFFIFSGCNLKVGFK